MMQTARERISTNDLPAADFKAGRIKGFRAACKAAHVEVTPRQLRKFLRSKGAAFKAANR
jgi:hypothetical protein